MRVGAPCECSVVRLAVVDHCVDLPAAQSGRKPEFMLCERNGVSTLVVKILRAQHRIVVCLIDSFSMKITNYQFVKMMHFYQGSSVWYLIQEEKN